MANVSLLIAVEDYADNKIQPVRFAAADLGDFSQALDQLGFARTDQVTRLDGAATKAGIESDLRMTIRRLAKDDTFVMYYAGHGFASNGENYITCHDTRRHDLVSTSVSLQLLYDELKRSECKRIRIFLDSCHSGLPADSSMRAIHTDLDDKELETFFKKASHCVCFAACRTDEVSYSSLKLKHGIWTHHVIEALRGDAPLAMIRNRFVTATSLQNYLAQAVPRTLRTEYATPKTQTPWMCGGLSGEYMVADLTPIMEQRQLAATNSAPRLDCVVISATERQHVKSLCGFKKTHRVPDRKNSTTDGFIGQISEKELEEDLDQTFQNLKDEYGFKRLELEKRGPSDGGGVIVTPYFDYRVSVELDPDDTSEVVWRREVGKISDSAYIFCDEFENVFSGVFDTIEISSDKFIKVSEVIDRIEQLGSDDISLDYDGDYAECVVSITGSKAVIRVTEYCLFVEDESANSPKALLESAMLVRHRLTCDFGIKALPAN